MWLLDHTCGTPAENLALDEALLDAAEAGDIGEGLRFWESPSLFVVLGLSQPVDAHVHREACAADNVPILRRCSAGGCVLQGPGCLNFSLILRTDRPGCQSITASYRTILGTMSDALKALDRVTVLSGTSDLVWSGRKVSGNAQRRRNRFFLHHGTLLLNFDIPACVKYLREPLDQPDYREKRSHSAFIQNLDLSQAILTATVSNMFQTNEIVKISPELLSRSSTLVREKYTDPAWNFRK